MKRIFHEHMTFFNDSPGAAWAYNQKMQQCIAYDNVKLVKAKAPYANQNHLARLMTRAINDDASASTHELLLDTEKIFTLRCVSQSEASQSKKGVNV